MSLLFFNTKCLPFDSETLQMKNKILFLSHVVKENGTLQSQFKGRFRTLEQTWKDSCYFPDDIHEYGVNYGNGKKR